MKYFINSISLLLASLIFTSCNRTNPNPININRVDSITIYYQFPDDSIVPPKKLTETNTNKFVNDWNNESSSEQCKYYPNYKLIVYLKEKEAREFRANGSNIKENTDDCFEFSGTNYFDELWKSTK